MHWIFPWISVTPFQRVVFSLLNGENSIKGDLFSQLVGWCRVWNKSPPFLMDEDILHISSFAWNLITLEYWLGNQHWVGVIRYSDRLFHMIHLLPPPRTKVQFRRNLNWQFEVDYFGTWNIHFSTISVKYRCKAGNIASVFSRKLFEIRTFVFPHVAPPLLSAAQDLGGWPTVENVSNCWNGSTEWRAKGSLAMPVGHLVDVVRFAGTCASFDLSIS